MPAFRIAELAIWFPAFLLSITFHEAAHAVTALLYGDRTAEAQASLNPIPHVRQEPIGTLVVPLFSFWLWGFMFGYASAPYDPIWASRNPRRAALMSAAGPMANLLLAAAALGILWILIGADLAFVNPKPHSWATQVMASSDSLAFVAQFLCVLFVLNLILGFFNLLPFPPLDGAGVIRGLFPGSAPARFLANMEERGWSLIGLLLAWVLFPRIFPLIAQIIWWGLGKT